MTLKMPKFSEYRRSGKVWRSPTFYYREGYKMCLAVYANRVGFGAGSRVSVAIILLRGEYDDRLKWPKNSCASHIISQKNVPEGHYQFLVCHSLQHQEGMSINKINQSSR